MHEDLIRLTLAAAREVKEAVASREYPGGATECVKRVYDWLDGLPGDTTDRDAAEAAHNDMLAACRLFAAKDKAGALRAVRGARHRLRHLIAAAEEAREYVFGVTTEGRTMIGRLWELWECMCGIAMSALVAVVVAGVTVREFIPRDLSPEPPANPVNEHLRDRLHATEGALARQRADNLELRVELDALRRTAVSLPIPPAAGDVRPGDMIPAQNVPTRPEGR